MLAIHLKVILSWLKSRHLTWSWPSRDSYNSMLKFKLVRTIWPHSNQAIKLQNPINEALRTNHNLPSNNIYERSCYMIISNYVASENKEGEEEERWGEEQRPIFGWVKHENVGQKLHSTLKRIQCWLKSSAKYLST